MGTAEMRAAGLLITPGAGSDRDHQTLVALEQALAPFPVERMDLRARSQKNCQAAIAGGIATVADRAGSDPGHVAIGGRSFGGRMCSMAVAAGQPAAALVLLSYPLHPPGKPDNLRTEHFPDITVPCLFVSGDRDPFATPDELERATSHIPGPVTHVWLEGGRHNPKEHDAEICRVVGEFLGAR